VHHPRFDDLSHFVRDIGRARTELESLLLMSYQSLSFAKTDRSSIWKEGAVRKSSPEARMLAKMSGLMQLEVFWRMGIRSRRLSFRKPMLIKI
jgi:hypothetical protein